MYQEHITVCTFAENDFNKAKLSDYKTKDFWHEIKQMLEDLDKTEVPLIFDLSNLEKIYNKIFNIKPKYFLNYNKKIFEVEENKNYDIDCYIKKEVYERKVWDTHGMESNACFGGTHKIESATWGDRNTWSEGPNNTSYENNWSTGSGKNVNSTSWGAGRSFSTSDGVSSKCFNCGISKHNRGCSCNYKPSEGNTGNSVENVSVTYRTVKTWVRVFNIDEENNKMEIAERTAETSDSGTSAMKTLGLKTLDIHEFGCAQNESIYAFKLETGTVDFRLKIKEIEMLFHHFNNIKLVKYINKASC